MSKEDRVRELTGHFRALGASDPELWARSQIEEGIPQYGRFIFLRQAWQSVLAEGDTSWIDRFIEDAEQDPRAPAAGIGPALKRLRAAGASIEDIAEVVRAMQRDMLEVLMGQVDDPWTVEYPNDKIPRVYWALFETDEDLKPLHPLSGLHESVLETEPSGR